MTIWNLGSINADMIYDVPHSCPDRGDPVGQSTGSVSCFQGLGN